MSRRRAAHKRVVNPDPKFNEIIVGRLVNFMMKAGKKSISEKIVYDAFDYINVKTKKDPILVFKEAMENIMPSVEVRSRRIGGATYQVPVMVVASRANTLALRWLVTYSRKRSGKTISSKLAEEILAAASSNGEAFKKKTDTHKMADANKAFSHLRW